MLISTFIQILAACSGIIGSLFFAIGVMRQTVEAMADLSGTYWDWNPHMIPALAIQKADYLFGGGIILIAFALQFSSFLVPNTAQIPFNNPSIVPWVIGGFTIVAFFSLRFLSRILARHFESQIKARLKERDDEHARQLAERQKANQQGETSDA